MKKLIALLLTAIMLFSVMSIGSFASVKSGKCGDNITWSVSGETMTLTGSGRMYDYKTYEDIPWNDIKFDIRKLVIANGITYIGDYAFSIMGIRDLVIPDSVTEIGDYSFFSNCMGTVTLGKNLKKIGSHAFASGYYSDLKFGNKLEEIGEAAFKDSHDLKSPVVIPNGVKVISNGAFAYSAMTSVVIPDSVESIEDFAFLCANITKAEIGKNVKHIGKSAFSGCHDLKQLVLPATVESFGDGAFYGCTTMKSITVFPGVESFGEDVFGYCHELVITCIKGSAVDLYAAEMGYKTDSRIFFDVSETAWYYEGIEYCYNNGIVKGMTETTFAPNGTLTRAQFVQILAMYDGVDLSAYDGVDCGFEDVKPSHWYNKAVCWAVEQGITSGLSATQFGPNSNVTRAQVARFLYVYCEKKGISVEDRADLSAFPDAGKVADWAKAAVEWAVGIGVISGNSKDGVSYLDPNGKATRAQACLMIMKFDDFAGQQEKKDELFYQLVDYIDANGSVSQSDPAVTEIVEEADDVKLIFTYDRELNQIYCEYHAGAFEAYNGNVGTYTDYLYSALVLIDDIDECYSFTVQLDDVAKQSFYLYFGDMYKGGAIVTGEGSNGFDAEYINTNSEIIKTELNSFMMKHITSAGIPLEMMFKDIDYNRDGSYKIIVDYIMANYEFEKNGWYTYATFAGGTDFLADYNPISGKLSFRVYDAQGDIAIAAEMTVSELGEAYYLEYGYWDSVSGKSADVIREIFADHSEAYLYDVVGMTEEEAYALEEDMYALFCEGLANMLSECGLTIADLYVTE